MTSYYAQNRGLSPATLELWRTIGERPSSVDERLRFYLSYFSDVVPYGVTVNHIPSNKGSSAYQEIQFWRSDTSKIWMSGLVSLGQIVTDVEKMAAGDAYTNHRQGDMVKDYGIWRFFTGLEEIHMYNCERPDEHKLMGIFHPIEKAWDLATHLQRQYDNMEPQDWNRSREWVW